MKKRVLLVDDNVDSRCALNALLRVLQVEAIIASSGDEAIKQAEQSKPEIALVDLRMPGMDGYQVAIQLRAMFPPDALKIVAVSGLPPHPEGYKQVGIDDYVRKPVMLETLRRVLGC